MKLPSAVNDPNEWDKYAEGYEAFFEDLTLLYGAEALDLIGLGPGERLLDVGAGPGGLALSATERGALVTAIDFSPAFVSRVLERRRIKGVLESSLEAKVMSASCIEFDDSTFDKAISLFALAFFKDRRRSAGEIFRVLKKGGLFAHILWGPSEENDSARLLAEAKRQAGVKSSETAPPWANLSLPGVAAAELSEAGFSIIFEQKNGGLGRSVALLGCGIKCSSFRPFLAAFSKAIALSSSLVSDSVG